MKTLLATLVLSSVTFFGSAQAATTLEIGVRTGRLVPAETAALRVQYVNYQRAKAAAERDGRITPAEARMLRKLREDLRLHTNANMRNHRRL